MQAPLITVDGISLTPPALGDADDWAAAQDDECARWFDWPCRPSVERCRDHLQTVTSDRNPDSYTWAIRTPAGFVGGIDLKLHEGAWNVSYFVHPEHRGRHIARRALLAVAEWGFAERHLTSISTRVHADNIASQKVLESAGFARTGTLDNAQAGHQDFTYARER